MVEDIGITLAELRMEHLRPKHRRPKTAIDVPSSVLLWQVLSSYPKGEITVVDMGSGFSTWVCRFWAHLRGRADVTSITTDQQTKWLNTTRNEVVARGWSGENFLLHDEGIWAELAPLKGKVSVLFLDTGPAWQRVEYLDECLDLLTPDGTLVVDDWHLPHVADHICPLLLDRGFTVVSCNWVADRYGRFIGAASKDHTRIRELLWGSEGPPGNGEIIQPADKHEYGKRLHSGAVGE